MGGENLNSKELEITKNLLKLIYSNKICLLFFWDNFEISGNVPCNI